MDKLPHFLPTMAPITPPARIVTASSSESSGVKTVIQNTHSGTANAMAVTEEPRTEPPKAKRQVIVESSDSGPIVGSESSEGDKDAPVQNTAPETANTRAGTGATRTEPKAVPVQRHTSVEAESKGKEKDDANSQWYPEEDASEGDPARARERSPDEAPALTHVITNEIGRPLVIEVIDTDGPPAPGDVPNGPTDCCFYPIDICQSLKASLVQCCATTLSFGTKSLVELAAVAGLTAAGCPAAAVPYVAGLIGGLWVGSVHQVTANMAGGLLNSCLGNQTYRAEGKTEWEKQYREFGAVHAPVLAFYPLTNFLRGYLNEGVSDLGVLAGSKMLASFGAAFFQGFVTDVIRQSWPAGFTAVDPKETTAENMRAQRAALISDPTARKIGHDYAGKILFSMVGNIVAFAVAKDDFPGATTALGEGALQAGGGMFAFLATGWVPGQMIGAALGNAIDGPKPAPGAPAAPAKPDVIIEMGGEESDSPSHATAPSRVGRVAPPAMSVAQARDGIRAPMDKLLSGYELDRLPGQVKRDKLAIAILMFKQLSGGVAGVNIKVVEGLLSSLPTEYSPITDMIDVDEITEGARDVFREILFKEGERPDFDDFADRFVSNVLLHQMNVEDNV